MINKYVTLITFIPWVAIYIISCINNLNNKNYRNFSWKYLKSNFFQIFRLDTLFLIIVFWYFARFNKEFVDKYLFAVICIYLCVNSFYEKKNKRTKSFLKDHYLKLILLFIVMLIPFIIYFVKEKLVLTYKIMLFYLFFQYIIILLVSIIDKLVRNNKKATIQN